MRVMGKRMVRSTAWSGIFFVMSGFANGALAADADETRPPPEAPDSTALSGGGFALDFKIWKDGKHGEPQALSVTYEWGTAGPRIARAQRQNDRWHVEFPDQPQPNEQASLQLRYSFSLSEKDKATVTAAAVRLEAAILAAVGQAGDKVKPPVASTPATSTPAAVGAPSTATTETTTESPPAPTPPADSGAQTLAFNAAFSELARPMSVSSDAETLRRYGTSSGQDGLSFVLEQLGIQVGAGGEWTIGPDASANLSGAAKRLRLRQTGAFIESLGIALEEKTASAEEKECAGAVPTGSPSAAQATAVLRKCAVTLEALAKKLRVDDVAAAAAAAVVAAAQADPPSPDLVNLHLNKIRNPALSGAYSYSAVKAASGALRALAGQAKQESRDAAILKGLEQAFENGSRVEDGATLIEGAAQPRRYDVATGVVFVSGIQDIVVPTLISICPAAGCLKANEVSWKGKNNWLRALSLDAGVRVKTLDTQDRRQSDKLSFLTGLSYNPVSVLRVSGGFYWFENAQSHNWTGQPYVGVTFNVLNAAEILGSLGLGDQVGPSTEKVK